MSDPIDVVIGRLTGVAKSGSGWTARCPAHEDHDPSLSVAVGDDERVLLKCHAGCTTEAVVRAMGMSMRDLFPSGATPASAPDGEHDRSQLARRLYAQSRDGLDWLEVPDDDPRLVAATTYGFHRHILEAYQVGLLPRRTTRDGRTYPAALTWPVKDGDGATVAVKFRAVDELLDGEKKSTTLGPARLGFIGFDALMDEARSGAPCAVCAGEKDLDHLAAALPDVVVVSKATGEGGGLGPLASVLAGRDVILYPDLDEAGVRSVGDGAALTAAGARVRVANLAPHLSGAADEKDVADLVRKYGAVAPAILREVLEVALSWKSTTADCRTEPNLTDLGNAERLIHRHGRDLRYVTPWKEWITYDEKVGVWVRGDAEVHRRAHETVRALFASAIDHPDAAKKKEISAFALRSESRRALDAMLAIAATLEGVAIEPEFLDAKVGRLVAANGVIDLRTGQLRPHRRDEFATRRTPIAYRPEARCPRFDRYLGEVFLADADLIDFNIRAIGYSLTGETREHVVFIDYGAGENGVGGHMKRDLCGQLKRDPLLSC